MDNPASSATPDGHEDHTDSAKLPSAVPSIIMFPSSDSSPADLQNSNNEIHPDEPIDPTNILATLNIATILPVIPVTINITLEINIWERFPAEIRDQIFDCVEEDDDEDHYFGWVEGKEGLPQLLVALRSLPKSYAHVLGRFSQQTLRLGPGRYDIKINEWTKFELDAVTKVSMQLSDIYQDAYIPCSEKRTGYRLEAPMFFKSQLLAMPSVREVQIYPDLDHGPKSLQGFYFTSSFPCWLRGCPKLTKVTAELQPETPTRFQNHSLTNLVAGLMKQIKNNIGIEGILSGKFSKLGDWIYTMNDQGRCRRRWTDVEVWVWESKRGKFMDWSGKMGFVYMNEPQAGAYYRDLGFWLNDSFLAQDEEGWMLRYPQDTKGRKMSAQVHYSPLVRW